MRKDNTWDKKMKAFEIRATFEDFDGGLDKWKEAFYTLWRYQLTWRFAYELELGETKKGVFVNAIVRKGYVDNIIETMDDLGYKNVEISDTYVGIVYAFDRDDMDDIEILSLDN